jgi:hypothetical protein
LASCPHHRLPPPSSRLAFIHQRDIHLRSLLLIGIFFPAHFLSSACAHSLAARPPAERGSRQDLPQPVRADPLRAVEHPRTSRLHTPYIVMQLGTVHHGQRPASHRQDPHRRRHHHRRPAVVTHVVTDTLSIGSKAPSPMRNEQWHILGILSIRPVRPDSSARAGGWRAAATERAASLPRHCRHRDLIVSIVVGTYIISTYHRHHAERAAPLLSEQSRSPSNPCDQILFESPSAQPSSSPARQDASIVQPVRPGPLRH